jgi:hypothetical protein
MILLLIYSVALLSLLLCLESHFVQGRIWISHSVAMGRPPYSHTLCTTRPDRIPLLVRGGEHIKFLDAAFLERERSKRHIVEARGGHSTHQEEQLRQEDDDDKDISSPSTTPTTSSLTTTNIATTTTISKSPNLIQHGGTIQRRTLDTNNGTTISEATTAQHPSSNNTTSILLSPKAAAKQEAKEQRKKEKEAKRRHKQIAKKLRVRTKISSRNHVVLCCFFVFRSVFLEPTLLHCFCVIIIDLEKRYFPNHLPLDSTFSSFFWISFIIIFAIKKRIEMP